MADTGDKQAYQDYLDYHSYLNAHQTQQAAPQAPNSAQSGGNPKPSAAAVQTHLPTDTVDAANPFEGPGDTTDPVKMAQMSKNAPAAAGALAMGIPGAELGFAGRAGLNAVLGATQGAAGAPDGQKVSGAVTGAALGAGIGSAAEGVAGAAGKGADWLMQKAVGMKKYLPGVGNELVDQGVVGTKNMMSDQVAQKIEDISDRIGTKLETAKQLQGAGVDGQQAAKPLEQYLAKLKVGGSVPGHSAGEAAAATDRLAEVQGRGTVDPATAWQYAKAAGQSGYRNQKAMQGTAAELAQAEQAGYSQAIKQAVPETAPDFGSLSNLFKANQSLQQPTTIRQGLPLTHIAASTIGATMGGTPGAAAGFVGSMAQRLPLTQALEAHALQRGVAPAAATLAKPGVQQSLYSILKGSDNGQ